MLWSVARVRLVNESKTLLKDKKFRVAGYDPEAREKATHEILVV